MEKVIVDCSTGTTEVVPLTAEEIAEREAAAAQAEADRVVAEAEAAAKAEQRAVLLAKLGITEDEAKLLLG
jgi:vacuolar-type H+-ATPase subunit H